MANNVTVTPGQGATIAAEDVGGGVLLQRIKLALGGSGTDLGDVSPTNPMPVSIMSESIEIGTVDQGNPNLITKAWTVQPTDGTNIQGYTANSEAKVSVTTSVLATGAATSANQTAANISLASIATNTSNTQGSASGGTAATKSDLVGGIYNSTALSLTNGQQSSLQLDVNGNLKTTGSTSITGTPNVSVTSSVLPTGAATAAGLTTINTTLGTPFQAGGSIANTSFGSSQVGTWNINNISGVVSLPTGAATAANQITANTSLATLVTNTPALGQALMAASSPVVIASNQSAIPISGTVTATISGVSTAINQTNGTQKTQIVDGAGTVIGNAVTLSGTNYLPVVQASSGTPGSAVPARATMVGGSDGTNLQILSTDTTGKLNINNISGTVSLATGAATSANQTNGTQTTQVVQGGNTLAVGTSGNIIVSGAAAVGTAPVLNPVPVSGVDGGGLKRALLTDTAGRLQTDTYDGSGNPIASNNSQLQTRDVINTAGQYQAISVTTTAVEAKGAGTRLVNRKLLSITPTNGTIYWGTSNAVTVASGSPLFQNQNLSFGFTDNVPIYIVSAGTVDTRVVEGS